MHPAAARWSLRCSASSAGSTAFFCSQLRTAESTIAETDILRSLASRSNSDLRSLDTRQLYTSVFTYYIVVHSGGGATLQSCRARHHPNTG